MSRLFLAASALVAGLAAGDPAPAISLQDVKEREVRVPAARVTLITFATRATAARAGKIGESIRVLHPDLTIYTFIDVSGHAAFLQGTIRSLLSAGYNHALKEETRTFLEAGKEPPKDLDHRVQVVADWDGSVFRSYGMDDPAHQAGVVVIGSDGRVKAVFSRTPSVEEVRAVVDAQLPAPQGSAGGLLPTRPTQ